MFKKKRLGVHIHTRGMKGGIRSINTPIYDVSLYELLKTYSSIQMQKTFKTISIPKLPVFTTEEGIKQINNNLNKITDWKNIKELLVILVVAKRIMMGKLFTEIFIVRHHNLNT